MIPDWKRFIFFLTTRLSTEKILSFHATLSIFGGTSTTRPRHVLGLRNTFFIMSINEYHTYPPFVRFVFIIHTIYIYLIYFRDFWDNLLCCRVKSIFFYSLEELFKHNYRSYLHLSCTACQCTCRYSTFRTLLSNIHENQRYIEKYKIWCFF